MLVEFYCYPGTRIKEHKIKKIVRDPVEMDRVKKNEEEEVVVVIDSEGYSYPSALFLHNQVKIK